MSLCVGTSVDSMHFQNIYFLYSLFNAGNSNQFLNTCIYTHINIHFTGAKNDII